MTENIFPNKQNLAIIKTMMNVSTNKFILATAFYLISLAVAFSYGNMRTDDKDASTDQPDELREGGHTYTNPLLECQPDHYKDNRSVKDIEDKIKGYIDKSIQGKKADQISVYFRNLNNGPWFAINRNERFDPASLLKVPMMVAYFKLSETETGLLEKKVAYKGEYDGNDNLTDPVKSIIAGKEYTVGELIYRMVAYSDNKSLNLVHRYIMENFKKEKLDEISRDMGIFIPMEIGQDTRYSITDYASVFRILYNSSYLNRELSEKALAILAEADYDDGLAAVLPDGVKIANKYGVHLSEDGRTLQLHDCGIIYHDKTPYLIFVMTKADKERQNDLVRAIQDISRIIYNEIDSED